MQSSSFLNSSPFGKPTPKKSFGTPSFRKSSRYSVSGKSIQSVQIILKSQYNSVERFGQPSPVLITEALTFADRNTIVSAAISNCGYAWVVCGRRLLIWQYKQPVQVPQGTPQRKNLTLNQCYELQLPQSDLSHRAELVSVFLQHGSYYPACIAVSPEGVIRYWPAIAHEGVSVEHVVDLQGQECDSLTDLEGLGCILATTTCSVVIVQPQLFSGRHTLLCRTLKMPSGWLGGISKRMSALIFGPISSEQSAETRLVRVLGNLNSDGGWTSFVLAGHSLQKWKLYQDKPEELVFVIELNRIVRDHFHAMLWENVIGDQMEVITWLLDLQKVKDDIIILAAAVNMHISPQIHYALIILNADGTTTSVKDFTLLKMSGLYREDNPAESLSFRFLWCNNSAYIYNHRSITVIKPMDEPDILEFNTPQDTILGGSVCVNTPIFFSRNNGLVAVTSNEFSADLNSSLMGPNASMDINDVTLGANLSVYNMDPMEIYNAFTDTKGQLKAAFIFHLKNQQSACQDIINELFPADVSRKPSVDNILDKVVVNTCMELLNDIPATDPRWSKDNSAGLGSSYSMQIINQLEDKQRAFTLFLKFLKDSNLWDQLGAYTIRDTPLATVRVLGELAEKLVAAITLKNIPNSEILQKAIQKAVEDSPFDTEYGLTAQDIFYSHITSVHRALQEIVKLCEDAAHSDMNPIEVANYVKKSNVILLNTLKDVLQYRLASLDTFMPSEAVHSISPENLPWTAANGTDGLVDALWDQHYLTHNFGMKLTGNRQLRKELCEQFVAITDLILDGRKTYVQSVKGMPREELHYKQYNTDKHKLILPLLQQEQWEEAAQLAEKYLDFECLIRICEVTDNQNRLNEYMDRFQAEGFTEFVYNWHLKENKVGKLIDRCRKFSSNRNTQKLTGFLTQNPSLSWMQQIFDKQFDQASETLRSLALQETESVTKQKTMFSLSKLSKLAGMNSRDSEFILGEINQKLDLITYQEDIPDFVLQAFGYDSINPPVISPKELIHLYTCAEYHDSTEIDFKKALDILKHINNSDLKSELNLKIWCRAVLKDTWDYDRLDSPLEILQKTTFFKIIVLIYVMGNNPEDYLPPLEDLIEDPSLSELKTNKTFLFLIQTGYEHIRSSMTNC